MPKKKTYPVRMVFTAGKPGTPPRGLPKKLPEIKYKGKTYTYDYRLHQLRIKTRRGLRFINLNVQENELLNYAIENNNRSLILANMRDLEWKL